MRLWDVSVSIQPGMPQWPGDPPVAETALYRTPGDIANVTQLALTTHTGTHVDPPRHFVHGGETVDRVPLERWVGPCWVADLTAVSEVISPENLAQAGIPEGTERLVLKTTNSALWSARPGAFVEEFVAVSQAGARWIVERGIRLVGIDYLSIAPLHVDSVEAHVELLSNDVLVVEGLDLSAIQPGPYELLCFPLKIREGDGAPARVALRGPLA